jgi:hypothetical protein
LPPALCGCQVAEQTSALMICFFPMVYNHPRPKRDLLLCVARQFAVTLSWHAPHTKAQGPGFSVSATEPSGVFFSRFCQSSSRSLGRCLLLGQRSRLNLLSDLIRPLFHQHHRDSHTEFSRHRNDGHSGSQVARVGLTHRAEKFPELPVLADRRPGSLDELTSKPIVSTVGNRSAIGSISGRVLRRHWVTGSARQSGPRWPNRFQIGFASTCNLMETCSTL